jgi:pyrroline-5-carboxylate reductase
VAKTVLGQLKGVAGKRIFSIVAGLTTGSIEEFCPVAVIRAMPNNPCRVGEGAIAICQGKFAGEEDLAAAEELFAAVGLVVRVQESQMDAVTGLSGSAPAFIYLVVEALSDGGVLAGLPRDVATKLAAQTVLGAAATVQKTGLHPAVLKEAVTSPAGTTISGLAALEKRGVRSAFLEAVLAATERSSQLGGTKESAQ